VSRNITVGDKNNAWKNKNDGKSEIQKWIFETHIPVFYLVPDIFFPYSSYQIYVPKGTDCF